MNVYVLNSKLNKEISKMKIEFLKTLFLDMSDTSIQPELTSDKTLEVLLIDKEENEVGFLIVEFDSCISFIDCSFEHEYGIEDDYTVDVNFEILNVKYNSFEGGSIIEVKDEEILKICHNLLDYLEDDWYDNYGKEVKSIWDEGKY